MIEAIAYFLSGSFLVQTIYPYLTPTQEQANLLNISLNWLILVIGAFMILVGFIAVSTTMTSSLIRIVPVITRRNTRLMTIGYRRLSRFNESFNRFRPWLLAIVFSITTTQIIPVLLNFGILPLSIVALAFFVFFTAAIVFMSWDILTRRAYQLAQITFAFTGMSIIRVFQGANKTELVTILVAIFIFILLTMFSIRRSLARQLPLRPLK